MVRVTDRGLRGQGFDPWCDLSFLLILRNFSERAARQQAAVTGQTEDVENDRKRDREIELERER